jgi:hypothetical protein
MADTVYDKVNGCHISKSVMNELLLSGATFDWDEVGFLAGRRPCKTKGVARRRWFLLTGY